MRAPIFLFAIFWLSGGCLGAEPLRVGLIGLDTSHVTAFTRLLNEEDRDDHVPGARVVAAFRGGSPDIESSRGRVDGFTAELRDKYGVEIVGSIEELCRRVDVVMLESVDGRPHLHQAIPVIEAGKPLFIDKPMAGSLGDVLAIFRLASERGVPVFSSSSLRYGGATQAARRGQVGLVMRAETHSPCSLEPHHPDLFWYGVHGVESLFTVMGTGCERVRRLDGERGVVVEGEWSGGRVGRFSEGEGYGGRVVGEGGDMEVGVYEGYRPLLVEVVKFFETGVAPVGEGETVEMFAFMEAADESKRRGGEAVSLAEVYGRYGYGVVPRVRLLRSSRIWDGAPHNAFTDLVRHGGRFYCVFREGEGHVSPGGAVRVLASEDGVGWGSVARVTLEGADLRDPKISVMPDGRLMLLAAGAMADRTVKSHQTFMWVSGDGEDWGEALEVGDPDIWLWRVQWHGGRGYGVGYAVGEDRHVKLYKSVEGGGFEVIVPRLFEGGYPNESALVFGSGGEAVCLLRRDGEMGTAQLGWSREPYTDWSWEDLGVRMGGPSMVELPGGELLAGVRLYDGGARTAVGWVDRRRGVFRELVALPSGGDTSYPGMVWWDGRLWVSYYSSHEGGAAIYLAELGVDGE